MGNVLIVDAGIRNEIGYKYVEIAVLTDFMWGILAYSAEPCKLEMSDGEGSVATAGLEVEASQIVDRHFSEIDF